MADRGGLRGGYRRPGPALTGAAATVHAPLATMVPAEVALTQVALAGSDWRLWGHALVRSAGFPVDGVLQLAPAGLAAVADAALEDPADAVAADAFRRRWSAAVEGELPARLAEIARADRFRLAVAWQNHAVLESGLAPLLRHTEAGTPRDRRQRRRERLVASYWQRYCVKNESIGFFGPLAWAALDPSGAASSRRCAPALVERATVHLENWGVGVLAARLLDELPLRPWLSPRRVPLLRLDGFGRLWRPDGGCRQLSDVDAVLLAAVDGRSSAADLAGHLPPRLPGVDVLARLGELHRQGLLLWDWALPASTVLDEELAVRLAVVPDQQISAAASVRLERLRAARRELQQVWEDPERVGAALDRLDTVFTELTGRAPNRAAGRAYAGRTLAYLECRRGVSVELGADFLAALAPLPLVLDSVRWLSVRIRELVLPLLHGAYAGLVARGDAPVTAAALWFAAAPAVATGLDRILAGAVGELHERWRRLVPYQDGDPDIQVSADSLRAGVRREFSVPGPGWSEARWCSPDLMIAATDLAELASGAGRLVLGELHAAMNATDYLAILEQHPAPDQLLARLDEDFPRPRLLLGPAAGVSARSFPALVRPADHWLALTPHQPVPAGAQVLAAADVTVVPVGGQLRLLAGALDFDVLDLFAEAIKGHLLRHFTLFPGGARPRITIDRLVVARRSWTFPAAEIAFAGQRDEPERFLGARAWRSRYTLPRFAFVKTPLETKPTFVDFDSPAYVEVLADHVRRAARGGAQVTVVEMLPEPDQSWLADAQGQRYTAEIRLVAVDTRDTVPGRREE